MEVPLGTWGEVSLGTSWEVSLGTSGGYPWVPGGRYL